MIVELEPYPSVVEAAVKVAASSPCVKSKRGAAIYEVDQEHVLSTGFNGPPMGGPCLGNEACFKQCNKYCVHAEAAAIQALSCLQEYEHNYDSPKYLVHAKVVDGKLVAGGPPSCWACANLILDCEYFIFVWLFEDLWEGPKWTCWDDESFYRATLRCQKESPRFEGRNGVEIPCSECARMDGAKRDKNGLWRCVACDPSP